MPIRVGETLIEKVAVGETEAIRGYLNQARLFGEPQKRILFAWGRGSGGRLGLGDTTTRLSPEAHPEPEEWISVASSSSSTTDATTLAVRSNGTLWGWGRQTSLIPTNSEVPYQLNFGNNWSKVFHLTRDFAFALKRDGTLWAWGNNSNGQLGLGDFVSRSEPTQVGSDTWKKVVCDQLSTSVPLTIGLKTDGTLWGWGRDQIGVIVPGGGTGINYPSPVLIDAGPWEDISLRVSGVNPVGVKSDNTLWFWGGTFGNLQPQLFDSQPVWKQVGSGFNHSVAMRLDGTLWSWGVNSRGELGLGDNDNRSTPTQIGNATWRDIQVSGDTTGGVNIAIDSEGEVFTWGDNRISSPALGVGDTEPRNVPTRILSSLDFRYIHITPHCGFAIAPEDPPSVPEP